MTSTKASAALLALATVLALPGAALAQDADDEPIEALDEAVAYLGGESLTALDGFTIEATGTRFAFDEGQTPGSETLPEAPYDSLITIDFAGDRMRLDNVISTPAYGIEGRSVTEVISGDTGFVDGQDGNFSPPGTMPMLADRVNSIRIHQQLLNPHLLVLEALEDPSTVTPHDDIEIDGTTHHVLEMAHGTTPITLLLDHETGQPRQATHMESDPLRGDTEVLVSYDDWSSDPVPFPGTVTVTYDGIVVQHETRSASTGISIDEAMFAMPEGLEPAPADPELTERGDLRHQYLQTFAGVGFPLDGQARAVTATELAPGVHHLTGGSHHSLAVIQDEGVVIVDAPLDEARTAAILGWLGTAATDLRVTHVVQSHHHADHAGGLRAMVGETGAVSVVGEAAVPFYEQEVFGATSGIIPVGPDAGAAEVMGVPAELTTIGSGTNPVNVVSFPNAHADDYVLVEAGGVLFIVDIYSPGTGQPLAPELVQAVDGLGLAVSTVAGGHGASEPWPGSAPAGSPTPS